MALPFLLGALQATVSFIMAFGAAEGEAVAASEKARLNCAAWGALVAIVTLVVGLLALTWRQRRSKRAGGLAIAVSTFPGRACPEN